jgi:hypothetical protein
MGTDNRDQGKSGQQNLNKPAAGKDNLGNKSQPLQGKYDPQSKGQAIPGKDAHTDANKAKFPSSSVKKVDPMVK